MSPRWPGPRAARRDSETGKVSDGDVFRLAFDSSPRPLLLIAADPPRFTMLAANDAHARTFSTTRDGLEGRGVFEVFPGDPEASVAQFMDAIRESFARVVATGKPDQMPVGRVAASAEGEPIERYWTASNTPILDATGAVTHIVSASEDVTAKVHERRSDRARQLLMREVDHRARNALTVVQSLVRLSAATSLEDFRAILDGRIATLARAQTSLAARKWEGAFLDEIVVDTLAAVSSLERVRIEGRRVVLPPHDVQAVSMIIHELATNAVKYGSLSEPDGVLTVAWERRPNREVRFVWREDGRAALAAPCSDGFGSRLIAKLVAQLDGDICYDWRHTGLTAELVFSLRGDEPREEPAAEA